MACQSKLPDCAHTYMFRSFVSHQSALWTARSFGVDAQLASKFNFEYDKDQMKFSVLGPGGSEVLQGAVQMGNSGTTNEGNAGSGVNGTTHLPRDGYNLHPYVGIPGVLGPGQARYICAFSGKVSVMPVSVVGNLQGGTLIQDLSFSPEGVLHIPDVSLMQLPPWGHGGAVAPSSQPQPVAQKTASKPRPAQEPDPRIGNGLREFFGMAAGSSGSDDDSVEMVGGDEPPRAPWMKEGGASAAEDFSWNSHKDVFAASSLLARPEPLRAAQASRRVASLPPTRSGGPVRSPGLGALFAEL